jgi:hypothetical protein
VVSSVTDITHLGQAHCVVTLQATVNAEHTVYVNHRIKVNKVAAMLDMSLFSSPYNLQNVAGL